MHPIARHLAATIMLATASTAGAAAGNAAQASVVAKIDLGTQEMNVYVDGKLRHTWRVASGRDGFETPTGTFRPQRLERDWHSRQYDDAAMPYSVFFSAGYAIHGGYSRMGRPASHGCIRLTTAHAEQLFELISEHGALSTRIEIDG